MLGQLVDKMESLWKEAESKAGILSRHLPGRTEETHENLSQDSICVLAEIRTE
jgi:hypothetical protein